MITRKVESYTYKTADGVRTRVSYLPEKDYIDKKIEPGMIYFIGRSASANVCVIQALLEDALWTDRDAFHDEAIKEMKRRIRYDFRAGHWSDTNTTFAVRIITAKGETITSQYSIPEREHLDMSSASDGKISIYLEYLLGELVRSAIRNLSESVIPTLKLWKDSNSDLRVPEYLVSAQASERADASINEREIINNRFADIKNTIDGIKDEMQKITSVHTAPAITPDPVESPKETEEQPEQNGMFSTKKRSWI